MLQMRYYVTTDIHGFFNEFKLALTNAGYFDDKEPHKLIVLGDLMDRGEQPKEVQEFIENLLDKDEVILIKGNHEWLMMNMLKEWENKSYRNNNYVGNGVMDTVYELLGRENCNTYENPGKVKELLLETPIVKKIIPAMLDYYETDHYIFTHGWIPCTGDEYLENYKKIEDWRNASTKQWDEARWAIGIIAAHCGAIEPGKTIVCGHRSTSVGHSKYEHKGSELGRDSDFSPYYAEGIIALDACTAYSRISNCIIIED